MLLSSSKDYQGEFDGLFNSSLKPRVGLSSTVTVVTYLLQTWLSGGRRVAWGSLWHQHDEGWSSTDAVQRKLNKKLNKKSTIKSPVLIKSSGECEYELLNDIM